ncbi:DEAD/DEAH box helicase [Methyloversatilis thermotolerans]|uniref:DEAD/DEAH box helicase n=1 Tax=Methyloversatilis thermotolerans TaxID=1346290 RepID=UPI00058DDD5A|nr:DEAD/DEAH box helicase [Methyloversatilis thermotolerans]
MNTEVEFSGLGLAEPLLRAVSEQGYSHPTPIQQKAIPLVMEGRDLLAAAQTGTGKTAGFTLPILHSLLQRPVKVQPGRPRVLVLTPTRELAAQVEESVRTYGAHTSLRSMVMFGGVGMNPQLQALKQRIDILVATPGRLLDHAGEKTLDLSGIEIFVLDEADRMLDMGFIRDIRKVIAALPAKRQTLLFSATFSAEIRTLAHGLLKDPAEVEVAPRNTTAERVDQGVYLVDQKQKRHLLAHLISAGNWSQVLVFTRTKHGANRLAEQLEKQGISAAAIHGNKSQNARTRALADFKSNALRVLVATDIAARGLDIDQLPHVVNFELPNVAEDYVHRIGRTGRAGASGAAVSLVDREEAKLLTAIEKLTRQTIPRLSAQGFVPVTAAADEAERAPRPPARPRQESRGRNDARVTGGQAPVRPAASAGARSSGERAAQPRRSNANPRQGGDGRTRIQPDMRTESSGGAVPKAADQPRRPAAALFTPRNRGGQR